MTKIVIGKYLAVLTLYTLAVAVIFIFPFMLQFYGTVTWPAVITGIIGYYLLGAALIAVGFFISSVTENQIVAAVISVVTIVLFFLLGNVTTNLPSRARYSIALCIIVVVAVMILYYVSTKKILPSVIFGVVGFGATAAVYYFKPAVFDDGLAKVIDWFSVIDRFSTFTQGIIDISDVVYFLSFIGVFLLLTTHSIEKTRWN